MTGQERNSVSTFASRPSTRQILQKSFHLSHADKIELKKISFPSENKKYATAQSDTTKIAKRSIDNGLQGRTDRTPARNKVLLKWRQKRYYETPAYRQVCA